MFFDDFIDKCKRIQHPDFDITRIDRLMENTGECKVDGTTVSSSVLASIKRFYENTNEYNRSKVADLINNTIDNIGKVHRIVIDYETVKNQQVQNETNTVRPARKGKS